MFQCWTPALFWEAQSTILSDRGNSQKETSLPNAKSCWAALSSQLHVKAAVNATVYAYHSKRLDLKDKYCARSQLSMGGHNYESQKNVLLPRL